MNKTLINVSLYGYYRSSTPINQFSSYRLIIGENLCEYDSILDANGYSVRAVAEEFE